MPTEIKCILNPQGVITEIGDNIESLFGYSREECRGRFLGDLVHSAHRHVIDALLSPSPADSGKGATLAFIDGEGAIVYAWFEGTAVLENDGTCREIRGVLRDMTIPRHRERAAEKARLEMETALKETAARDALTGVYNRLYFEKTITGLDARPRRPVSVLTCDINGLRRVNKELGFEAGNALLVAAADLIRKTSRETDIPARTACSQFTLILPQTDADGLDSISKRLHRAFAEYNETKSAPPHLSVTLGAATAAPGQSLLKTYFKAENIMFRKKMHCSGSTRNSVVQVLSAALAERDAVTEAHAHRIGNLTALLGAEVGLGAHRVADLRLLAQFHDIGKLAVPDCILLKPGPLSPEERIEMNRHPEVGYRIALSSPDLAPIADKILTHHEWWNGNGYPLGLSRDDIPLECRILAVIDAYDAMTSDRPYRKAMSHRDAMQELVRYSGIQFDPGMVRSFIKLTEQNRAVSARPS